MESWLLGVVGSIAVIAVGGAVGLILNHEKRIASIESSLGEQSKTLVKLDTRLENLTMLVSDIRPAIARLEAIMERQHND